MKLQRRLLSTAAALLALAAGRASSIDLGITFAPTPGGSFNVRVTGGPPGGTALLFFASNPATDGLQSPPLIVPGLGEIWLTLVPPPVPILTISLGTSGPLAGIGDGGLPVPAGPGIAGFRFTVQALVLGSFVGLSNPLYVRVGPPSGVVSPAPGYQLHFGTSIALGDLTGDGVPDLAVGEPDYNFLFTTTAGKVHVFAGPSFSTLVMTKTSPTGLKTFGSCVAVGDFNGVGGNDLLVGEWLAGGGPCYPTSIFTGAFHVYYGPALADPPVTLHPPPPVGADGQEWGFWPATMVDVDGDGKMDLFSAVDQGVTTPCPALALPGMIYARIGGAAFGWISDPQWCPPGPFSSVSTSFGHAGSAAGNVNGGGIDLFIPAESARIPPPPCPASVLPSGNGVLYGYEFNASGAATLLWTLTDPVLPPPAPNAFGESGVALGDFDGDGHDDVLSVSPWTGKAVVFFGPTLVSWVALDVQPGLPTGGYPVFVGGVAAGDVNGDGFDDAFFVHSLSPLGSPGSIELVSYYLGAPSPYTFRPAGLLECSGASVVAVFGGLGTGRTVVQDVDGNGRAEVIIGHADSTVAGNAFAGAVAVFTF